VELIQSVKQTVNGENLKKRGKQERREHMCCTSQRLKWKELIQPKIKKICY